MLSRSSSCVLISVVYTQETLQLLYLKSHTFWVTWWYLNQYILICKLTHEGYRLYIILYCILFYISLYLYINLLWFIKCVFTLHSIFENPFLITFLIIYIYLYICLFPINPHHKIHFWDFSPPPLV